MSDSHDNGAAARIRDAITLGARTGLECATVHRDDLLAVLAENETMRQQLSGLKIEWVAIHDDPEGGECQHVEPERVARVMARGSSFWRLKRRLVGPWQPAEGGGQP